MSAWVPLGNPVFRSIWLAIVASNIGTWMHDVGTAWLMTSLTPSPLLVSLLQTATTLPVFLLAVPAGALADVVDRRRMLMLLEAWMCLCAFTLGALTLMGLVTPVVLLVMTFALGMGAAMDAPAWQATTPEVVPKSQLPSAVALSSVAINIARAVGPALGGFAIAASWLEHLRQHERVTVADRDVEAIARAFHVGTAPPLISHFVSGLEGRRSPAQGPGGTV